MAPRKKKDEAATDENRVPVVVSLDTVQVAYAAQRESELIHHIRAGRDDFPMQTWEFLLPRYRQGLIERAHEVANGHVAPVDEFDKVIFALCQEVADAAA